MSWLKGSSKPSFPEIPADQVPEKFVVRQCKTLLAMGLILIVVFGGATVQNAVVNGVAGSLDTLTAGVWLILAGIAVLLKYKNHRLEVDGETLRYTDMFGHQSEFQVSDIAGARQDISENPKLFTEDGTLLARFDRNMENFVLMIAYLKKYHVSAET